MSVHQADLPASFEIADRQDVRGANPYRIRACCNVARPLAALRRPPERAM